MLRLSKHDNLWITNYDLRITSYEISNMLPETRILITKFPFRSRLSGVEKHTFQIVENFEGRGVRFFLLSSCPVMLSEFKKRGWPCQRWWLGLAPVSSLTKWLFFVSLPFLIISAAAVLIYFKLKHRINKLYCLTLTEKIIMTPIARVLGIRVLWLEHLSIEPVITRNIFRPFYVVFSSLATVVAVSEYVKNELNGLDVTDAKVIYHGVDFEKYKKQEDLFGSMADVKSIAAERNNFRIGCVSRLEKLRGLEYLIKAVDLLKERIPEIDCVIVGEGTERKNLIWLAEQLDLQNKVKLVGYKDNFLDWIYDFDVFVLPSLKESLGIILIEAIAAGRPVIATNVGGTREIIENNVNGILVEPMNPRAIADAIIHLRQNKDLVSTFVDAGKKTVQEKFGIRKMMTEYERLLLV
ncbi:glycosyltransferase family 4 protein [Candidatus Falkowbacteria bacterium]|nr:glycosyltransferase family 4 protein [Candidatus Falkowbacteria bacterium]